MFHGVNARDSTIVAGAVNHNRLLCPLEQSNNKNVLTRKAEPSQTFRFGVCQTLLAVDQDGPAFKTKHRETKGRRRK